MNFVELCRDGRGEMGISYTGSTPTPTTTVNQTGVLGKIVGWIRDAWIQLQNDHPDWKFLRAVKVYSLTISNRTYDLITDLALQNLRSFDKNGCYIEENSDDKSKLTYEEWEVFRERVISTTTGRPQVFTENLDGDIEFEVIPDKAYVVRLGYWMTAESLDDDADVPSIDEDFHKVIVWEAVLRYCGSNTSGELYQYARGERDRILARMNVKYLVLQANVTHQPLPGLR